MFDVNLMEMFWLLRLTRMQLISRSNVLVHTFKRKNIIHDNQIYTWQFLNRYEHGKHGKLLHKTLLISVSRQIAKLNAHHIEYKCGTLHSERQLYEKSFTISSYDLNCKSFIFERFDFMKRGTIKYIPLYFMFMLCFAFFIFLWENKKKHADLRYPKYQNIILNRILISH